MPARLPKLAPEKRNVVEGPSCLAGTPHVGTFATLVRCAPPPTDRAGWVNVCQGAYACLRATLDLGFELSDPAKEALSNVAALVGTIEKIDASRMAQSTLPMWRRFTQHPQWSALAKLSQHSDPGIAAAMGITLFSAIEKNSAMSVELTRHVSRLKPGTLSVSELKDVLLAARTDVNDAPVWAKRLNHLWPDVSRWMVAVRSDARAQTESNSEKLRKSLLFRCLYATPKHRGGILDHRHIDLTQCLDIGKQIAQRVRDGDARSAAAMLASLSPITVDQIAGIPLADHKPEDWVMCVNVEAGLFVTDIQCIAKDLPRPIARNGHIPSSTQYAKPLPSTLRDFLKTRLRSASDAECIGHLVPEIQTIRPRDPVIATTREIVPSFARWTNSIGVAMRQLGMDALAAGLLSGDFSMFARSKLYYTAIQSEELWKESTELYSKMGWGSPSEMPANTVAVGSPLVPRAAHITKIYEAIRARTEIARPSKRTTPEKLFEFHNRYCKGVAWVLGFACASRHTSELQWTASMLTSSSGLLVICDKQVSDLEGGLPVPIASFVRKQVDLYVRHLYAMYKRLESHVQSRPGKTIKWLAAVLAGKDAPLFRNICDWQETVGIGTAAVLEDLPEDLQLALDSGRKHWETHLRLRGVSTSSIDFVLRHEVMGQERFSFCSDFITNPAKKHIAQIMDEDLYRLFGSPLAGLRHTSFPGEER